jgi:hypothetical protein
MSAPGIGRNPQDGQGPSADADAEHFVQVDNQVGRRYTDR